MEKYNGRGKVEERESKRERVEMEEEEVEGNS